MLALDVGAVPADDSSAGRPAAGAVVWSTVRMPSTTQNVAAALAASGATGEIRQLSQSARTAALAAQALGVEVGAIANSLVFRSGDDAILVLTSGAHRVDEQQVAAVLELPELTRADADFVRRHTGQAIGGVAPVGHPAPLRTVVDVALAGYDVVWAAAGSAHTVFATSYDELLRLTGGSSAEVG